MSDADENKCFTFWENWYLMAEGRDTDEKRLAFYDALFRFAFDGEIPQKPRRGDPAKVWAAYDAYLAASQIISRNMDLREQGRHGGMNGKGVSRNKGNQNARKHPKTEAETKAEDNSQTKAEDNSQTKAEDNSQTKPNNIIENNIIENDIMCVPRACARPPTQNATQNAIPPNLPTKEEMILFCHQVHVPDDYLEVFLANMSDLGWEYMQRGGAIIKLNRNNFKSVIKSFYKHKDDGKSARSRSEQPEGVILQQEGYDASFLNGE